MDLQELVCCDELYDVSLETLKRMGFTDFFLSNINFGKSASKNPRREEKVVLPSSMKTKEKASKVTREDLKVIVKYLNDFLFLNWEKVHNFYEFATVLENFLDILIQKSFLSQYPLNLKIATRIFDIKEEFKKATFQQEHFPQEDIFKIFESKIEHEIVAFVGSPLKGLQLLGLFETRSLNFENVIVLDVNEGVLPRLRIYEPLIPREVMIGLNLDRLELEEEIQRYQFMRLISSAKNVHLVYQESKDKEKSRFVEELIWEEEKKGRRLESVGITRPSFEVKVVPRRIEIKKTPEIIAFLKNFQYSASSINMYLRNPLEFYYNRVLGLQEKEDLLDEPEAKEIGTFVHELLEDTFKKFIGKKSVIDEHFRRYFLKVLDERFEETFGKSMKSDSFLLKSVLNARMNRFLEQEASSPERKISKILFIERFFKDKIPLSCGSMNFAYKVDRVDQMEDGSIMIVDYKTGSIDPMPKAIDKIESMPLLRETIRDTVVSFQIPLYFYYLDKEYKNASINAAFYNLRTMEIHKFIDERTKHSRKQIISAFMRALNFVMAEILDPEIPFIED